MNNVVINVAKVEKTVVINATPNVISINVNYTSGSAIYSIFGRTGNVIAEQGDYNADQITETAERLFISPEEKQTIADHIENIENPHNTTASQVGAYTIEETDAFLSNKVDLEAGKGLSENNYTTVEKTKLSGIEEGAEVNVNADWDATSGDAQILNKPNFGDMLKATYDKDNSGVVDNAESIIVIGRNSTGSVLRKGTIVYISGSTGNRPNFVKAQANSEATSAGTFGVITDDILNNADGICCIVGFLDNLDTRVSAPYPFTNDTLADGDTIYLSPTNAGYITNQKPSAPNHLVYLGKVTRTSPTNGTIVYRIQNGYELEELHNVAISNEINEDFLQFEASTSLWKNIQLSASWLRSKLGITTLSGSNTGDQDLSGLATKSMGAYKMRVNNKNATANATETNYRSQALQTLTGISWTGTTAPTGGTQQYQWQQEGNKVTAIFTGNYGTAGTLLTQVNIALPSDMPTPIRPAGIPATAGNLCYMGVGRISTSLGFTTAITTTAGIVVNSANTANFDVVAFTANAGARYFWIQITYFIA